MSESTTETAFDRPCPHCQAQPGEPCRRAKSTQGHHVARLVPLARGNAFTNAENLVRSRVVGARKSAARRRRAKVSP